jgi:uncharacterized protein (DUF1697 family)
MPRLIAFLRAINVGGHVVKMETLRKAFEALGLTEVETFIASGNVIFSARSGDTAALAKKIEARLRKTVGYEVATFVRTCAEVADIARYQAFKEADVKRARTLSVGFLDRPLDAAATRALMAFRTEIDDFHASGREVYWLCKKGQSDSTFTNAGMEKTLKIRATFRNINTVARLAAKHGPT